MKTENLYWRLVLNINGWALIACLILITACSIGVPSHSKQFMFELGKKSFEIDIDKQCTYEIGISFASQGGHQAIKNIFGHARQIYLPALIDISLLNDSGKSVFSAVDFGGSVSSYRYGPNPLKLIAGKVYLEPGKYTAIINIKDIEKDFSEFETYFFVSGDPKGTCGRGKLDRIIGLIQLL